MNSFVPQMIFMGIGIAGALFAALGFVALGKSKKQIGISVVGFLIISIILLIKLFETNLFFLGRAIAFLVLGSISLILVIFLSNKNNEEELEEKIGEETEEKAEIMEGDTDEEANSDS